MKSRKMAFVIIASVALLYAGSYIMLVTPAELPYMTGIHPGGSIPTWPRVPHYKFGGQVAEVLFAPAVAIDKILFPKRWIFTLPPQPN